MGRSGWLSIPVVCACFNPADDSGTGQLSTESGTGTTAASADDDPSASSDPSATSPTSATTPTSDDDSGTSTTAAESSSGDDVSTLDASSDDESSTGEPVEEILYDLYEQRCSATWLGSPDPGSAAEVIDCDGPDSFMGAVSGLRAAVLDGDEAVELVVRTVPWSAEEGTIGGVYDGISLIGATAPVFRTRLACPADAPSCSLNYQVLVRMAGATGIPDIVEEGIEVADGASMDIEIDLADYAGGAVKITLAIFNDGMTTGDDIGLWAHPRIVEN